MPPRAEAAGSWSRGTSSGMSACQAGTVRVWAQPSRKVKVSSSAGLTWPAAVRTASTPAASIAAVCTPMSSRRRSNTSANTPAGRARKNTGDMLAVCTRATSVSAFGWSTSSHCAPTVCIQVPTRLASWASHSAPEDPDPQGAHAVSMACLLPAAWRQRLADFLAVLAALPVSSCTRSPMAVVAPSTLWVSSRWALSS